MERGVGTVALDNANGYYDPGIKLDRPRMLAEAAGGDGAEAGPRGVRLLEFVDTLRRVLVGEGVLPGDYDFAAHREFAPMQPGDVPVTYADASALGRDLGWRPSTPLEDGLREFARWYRGYYGGVA